MPDIVRLRYLGTQAHTIVPISRVIDPDSVFDLPGAVFDETDDCYLIETGNPATRQAWPKSLYAVETPTRTKKEATA